MMLRRWTGILTTAAAVAACNAEGSVNPLAEWDLEIAKIDIPDPVPTGGTITYIVTVVNHGPDHATGIRLRDTPQSGLLPLDHDPTICTSEGTSWTCNLGTIAPGESIELVFLAQAPETPGVYSNAAQLSRVGGGHNDTDPSNDEVTISTTVVRPALSCQAPSVTHIGTGDLLSITSTCSNGTLPLTVVETGGQFANGSGTGPCTGLNLAINGGVVSVDGMMTDAGFCDGHFTVRDNSSPTQETTLVIPIHAYDPLTISSKYLADAVLSQAYNQQIGVTGGSGATTFTITAGTLPPGLSLNASTGAITGTATQTVTRTVTIRATNTLLPSQSDERQFTIDVRDTPAAFTIRKQGPAGDVELGTDPGFFVVVVTNTGDTPITHLELVDVVPPSLIVYPNSLPAECSLLPTNAITCSVDRRANPIPRDSSYHLFYFVQPAQAGHFTNSATAMANGTTTGQASDDITVVDPPPPAFTLKKFATPDNTELGTEDVGYFIVVKNVGTRDITRLDVVDAVPPSLIVSPTSLNPGCSLSSGNTVRCTLDLQATPIRVDSTFVLLLYFAEPTQTGVFTNTATVTANGTTTQQASAVLTVNTADVRPQVLIAANVSSNQLLTWSLGATGALTAGPSYSSPSHTGPSELLGGNPPAAGTAFSGAAAAFTPPTSAVYATYITSKDIVRYNVGTGGALSEAASFTFPESPFQFDLNPQNTCIAVPLQSTSRIQMLTADLAPASLFTIPSGFPTKVLFNSLYFRAYAVNNQEVLTFNADPATCTLTQTGATVYPDRRDVAIDPHGEFLFVLTWKLQGNVSTFVLQRLTQGNPAGAGTVVPLPAAGFLLAPHPTRDVVYVLQDAPSTGFRKLTFDRVSGAVTVGAFVSAPGVDEVQFNLNATRLYYTNVASPTHARICWFDLSPLGDLLGTPTCDDLPARSIDADLLIATPPSATLRLRRRE